MMSRRVAEIWKVKKCAGNCCREICWKIESVHISGVEPSGSATRELVN
jgi:hypothetical protein